MNNILFINHWGFPDLHMTREPCKKIINHNNDKKFKYITFRSYEYLNDVCEHIVEHTGFTHHDTYRELEDERLCVNTSRTVLDKVLEDSSNSGFEKTLKLLRFYSKKFFNDCLSNYSDEDLIPNTIYDTDMCFLGISHLKLKESENNILVDNSMCEYDFDDQCDYDSFISELSKKHKDRNIIATYETEKLQNLENVYFKNNIFPYSTGINEISWFSRYCSTIIGKNKDYFTSCLVKDNVNSPSKKIINIKDENLENLIPKEMFSCDFQTIESEDLINLIDEEL